MGPGSKYRRISFSGGSLSGLPLDDKITCRCWSQLHLAVRLRVTCSHLSYFQAMPKMKTTNRAVVGVSLVLILLLMLLTRHFLDLANQYSAFAYFRTSLSKSFFHASPENPPTIGVEVDDKVIVMAKMESEDADWVARELPSFVITPFSFQAAWPYADTRPFVR